jgi:hypothetical protein
MEMARATRQDKRISSKNSVCFLDNASIVGAPFCGNPQCTVLFLTAASVPVSKGSAWHFLSKFAKAEIINSVEVE